MARKNLLKGLMDEAASPKTESKQAENPPAPQDETRVNPAKPRYGKGAIGAVSQSIADLKSRSVIEVDLDLIDRAGLSDRLGEPEDEHQRLVDSIRDYGQQVPILLRPHPEKSGRYEVVYGRRRVLALRSLGLPAKALVRDLDDKGLILAQGQENSARRDLSFIEKCNFARQMRDAEYDRKIICDALSVDKTLISRMLSVADRIPVTLIEAIGPAPGIGRDRWLGLSERFESVEPDLQTVLDMVHIARESSDARFEAAFAYLDGRKPAKSSHKIKPVRSQVIKSENGIEIGKITRSTDQLVLSLPRRGNGGFEDWLADNLAQIHRTWSQDQSGE